MLSSYVLEKAMDSRNQQTIRYAENQRMIREALAARREIATHYDRALSTLGNWLIGWGKGLQARHGCRPLPSTRSTAREQAPLSPSLYD